MELEDLKQLIELLKETDITEIQVEKEGTKVKIKREKFFQSLEIATQKVPSVQQEAAIKKEIEEETQRLITVTSPIVGTFYRSPSPEAPIFVDTGRQVKKGQVLCIILWIRKHSNNFPLPPINWVMRSFSSRRI